MRPRLSLSSITAVTGRHAIGRGAVRRLLAVLLSLATCAAWAQNSVGVPVRAPQVLYTDIASGPNKGGENDKGIYLSVFGKNFGDAAGLGKTTKLYIGDAEVDNYRFLGASRARPDIQQLSVQIGFLGDPKPGVPLPLKVVVNGVASNTDQAFIVNPGKILFVANDGSGSDANPATFERPFRTVQRARVNNNGQPGCPISAASQATLDVGIWALVGPGDFIVMRGGRWTDDSRDNFFLRVQNKSGTAPTGAPGTGPITIMGYPGETVFIDRTNTQDNRGGGGISSADSARQALGCGAWVTVTNLKVESGLNEGMITSQRGVVNPAGSHWRVVNNEMTAISCQNNTRCRGGGMAGSGAGQYWVGNYVHDVYDKPDSSSSFENHGFYVDGAGSYEIAYSRIENIFGGNGVQTYSTSSPITNNVRIHHNMIRGVGKHGINLSDGTEAGIVVYNNLVVGSDVSGLRINSRHLTGAKVYNNTFFDTDRLNLGGQRAAIANDWDLKSDALEFINNIVVAGGPQRVLLGGSVGFRSVDSGMSNNLWFNGRGAPTGARNLVANPQFVSLTQGAEDFRLNAKSPAIDAGAAGVSSLVTDDFDAALRRPQGKGFDIGAFEQPQR